MLVLLRTLCFVPVLLRIDYNTVRRAGLVSAGQCHLWADFLVGSRLALRVFSRYSDFSLSEKSTFPNSSSIRMDGSHENQLGLMWLVL